MSAAAHSSSAQVPTCKAARKQGVDGAPIAADLTRLSPERQALPLSADDLIDQIFARYHATRERELRELGLLPVPKTLS